MNSHSSAIPIGTGVTVSYSHTVYSEPRQHDGVVFCTVPIHWTVGVKAITDSIFGGSTRLLTKKPFIPKDFLGLIEKYKVAVLLLSPLRTVQCLKSDIIGQIDLSSVKRIYYYGNTMPMCLVGEVRRYFVNAQAFTTYGMTEIGGIASCFLDASTNECGGYRLFDGCLAKIVDENGNRCVPNINGEICVKKSYRFRGYFEDPAATEATVDDEDFLRTGDIGHFNENGAMFIEGRKKSSLRCFHFDGYVLPAEIEEHLLSLPDVKEACVVGIPVLKLTAYVIPAAVIVLKTNSSLKPNDIYNEIAGEKMV